ncbi:Uncharacterised protein [Bordetella holmesii]|nr:Uncharacterised protein [Bordetella holmesii]
MNQEKGLGPLTYLEGSRLQLPDAVAQRLRKPVRTTPPAPPPSVSSAAVPHLPTFDASGLHPGGTALSAWPD